MEGGFVYIVSNKNRATLYVGVTSDLKTRIADHKMALALNLPQNLNLQICFITKNSPIFIRQLTEKSSLKTGKEIGNSI